MDDAVTLSKYIGLPNKEAGGSANRFILPSQAVVVNSITRKTTNQQKAYTSVWALHAITVSWFVQTTIRVFTCGRDMLYTLAIYVKA